MRAISALHTEDAVTLNTLKNLKPSQIILATSLHHLIPDAPPRVGTVRKSGVLTEKPLYQQDAYRMIQTRIGNHTFRATGITAYLKNSGRCGTALTATFTLEADSRRSVIRWYTQSVSSS
jgi:hypothetical protein